MFDSIEKSKAPLFASYGANPNEFKDMTNTLTAEQMIEHLTDTDSFEAGFENGEIVCALVPIDFQYNDENGKPVCGEVDIESLVNMLKLQAAVARGETPILKDEPEQDDLIDLACVVEKEEKVEELPAHIGIDKVDEILTKKGYATPGTKKWDADAITYWVIDSNGAMSGIVAGPCGSYYPMKPVNNPIWGKEDEYEPMFLTAQVEAIPVCG